MIPRPCSEPEDDALRSVAIALQERGYAVDVEEFGSRPSGDPWLAAYAGLAVVAVLSVYVVPVLTATLGAVAVVLHARDSEGRPLLRRHSCTGRNVVARSPAAPAPVLVVVAPAEVVPSRFAERTQRALLVSLQSGMAAVAAGGAAAWVAEGETELPVSVAAGGAVAAAAVAALAIVLYGSGRPTTALRGTLDVLLRLAPELRDDAVWLVASGGRRAGMTGIQAFLDAHPETGGAWWLNLEPAPGGEVYAVSEEGTWRERRADRFLLGAAEQAGAGVRPCRAAPTDATVLLARRRRALTLMVGAPAEGLRIALATARAALAERRWRPGSRRPEPAG
ncbi:MAG: hypothetical protein M3323_05155 [Actinomycetota bacterium]|nr:hypothetical protein [Actinomycetota bacterium]